MNILESMMLSLQPDTKKESDDTGISSNKVDFSFFASEIYAKQAEDAVAAIVATPAEPVNPNPLTIASPSAEEQVMELLLKNPGISVATFLNVMKSNGLAVVDQKKAFESEAKESDGTSIGIATTRGGAEIKKKKKESAESFKDSFVSAKFFESTAKEYQNGNGVNYKYKVALIQEGLGNLRDGFYYTREAIQSAVAAFEGKKCYADHPSRSEEVDRPERSVRDILGHYENVHVEEAKDGSAMLCADLVMLPDTPFEWARALVRNAAAFATKFPDKEFVGLSINASGDAQPMRVEDFMKQSDVPASCKPKIMKAIEQGLTQVRVVSSIHDAVSTDLVTEPGARGKVLEMLETEKENNMEKKEAFPPKKDGDDKDNKEASTAEAAMDEKKEADGADANHTDAGKDKKLISDMIKKHMGDKEMSDDEKEAAHKAFEAYSEMGMEKDKACEAAGQAMKLAKHMAAKKAAEAAKESSKEDASEAKKESMDKKEDDSKTSADNKESGEIVTLEARVAFLEAELNKERLDKVVDKKLQESKLPRSVTDKIRAKGIKTEKQLDETIKVYVEAFSEAGTAGSESKPKSSIFNLSTEKTTITPSKDNKVNFAECKK